VTATANEPKAKSKEPPPSWPICLGGNNYAAETPENKARAGSGASKRITERSIQVIETIARYRFIWLVTSCSLWWQ